MERRREGGEGGGALHATAVCLYRPLLLTLLKLSIILYFKQEVRQSGNFFGGGGGGWGVGGAT